MPDQAVTERPVTRVRVGQRFTFERTGLDRFAGYAHTPQNGTIVEVCQPYGCPRNGTMGQCYVQRPGGGFIGMVAIASLRRISR